MSEEALKRSMGALILQLEQTLLYFVGIPLAVIAIVAGIIYAGGRKSTKRYRPGRPYEYAPVWFTSAAKPSDADEHPDGTRAELPGSQTKAISAAVVAVSAPGVTGGASDRW
jgi:hypothetical protein